MNRQRAAHGFDADLDEDAGGVLDVVPGGLNQPLRLPQLGEHAPGAFRRRRMHEEGLTGEARSQGVGVILRVFFPGSHLLQLEHPAANVLVHHPVLEPLDRCQRRRG